MGCGGSSIKQEDRLNTVKIEEDNNLHDIELYDDCKSNQRSVSIVSEEDKSKKNSSETNQDKNIIVKTKITEIIDKDQSKIEEIKETQGHTKG